MSETRPETGADVADAMDEDAAANPAPPKADAAPIGKKGRGWVVNKSQLSSVLGRPMTFIDRLIRAGAPVLKRGASQRDVWEFNTADFVEFVVRDALERAGLGQGELSYEVARRREKDAQAKLRELDLQERQGIVVNIESIRPRIRDAFTNTRSRMLAVSSQVIGLTHQQQRQLEDAINDALAELSDPKHWAKLFASMPGDVAEEATDAAQH